MKIIFAALEHDYGDPKRGFSFEYENFYSTLKSLGHEVIYYDFDQRQKELGNEEMNRELRILVDKEKPELLFCALFNDEIDKKMIKDISDNTDTVTYNWFFDDHWRFDTFSKYWVGVFNWVSTTDPKAYKRYQKLGHRNVIKTQYAVNDQIYKKQDLPKEYGVTFIGQLHGTRGKVISWLRNKGVKVNAFGFGTEGGRVSQEDMIKIINQSKINLCLMNLSRDPNWKGFLKIFIKKENGKMRFDFGNIINNFSFFLAKQKLQIKARNFEIPGAGSLILTNHLNELSDFFEIGKEIVTFKNKIDLVKKINYYLEHEEEREKIALAGYNRTIKDHTYQKRFERIFNKMFSNE